MKQCPQCKRIYPDETLNYCLDDGAELFSVVTGDENPTAIKMPEAAEEITASKGARTTERTVLLPTERIPVQRGGKQKFFIVAAVTAILAAGVFIYRSYYLVSSPISSIAVLPFKSRGGDAETQYLSEGLAESLIYRLSQLPDLKVSPTSSVFRYEDKDVDPVAVGNELGVHAVLSGRIVQHGDSLTISADLVDVRDNRVIWGEQYDRKMSELLDTQREIAREIVETLKLRVANNEKGLTKHYTENNEAYQAYLKGRYYWNKRTNESMHRSIDYFKQAIEIDPSFALAYSGLADTYNLISAPEAGGGDESPADMLPKAKAAALKALEIDPTLAEAHNSLAHPLYYYDRDWAGAEREFKRSIELNPRYATVHHWYAVFLTVTGRWDEALAEVKRAQELDPLSLSINVWVGWILASERQPDAALEQLLKTKEMDPNFLLTRHRLALLYADQKRYNEAIKEANEMLQISEGRLGTLTLGYVYAAAGKRKEAVEQVDKLVSASHQRFVSPAAIGMIYAVLGDKDTAFEWLKKANDARDMLAVRVKYDPRFATLRGDPRLDDLVKSMGLP
jgi:TolB-like protein/Flp pilus assembly protein TadD